MDYGLLLCSEAYAEALFRLKLPWDEGKEKSLLTWMTLQLKNSSASGLGITTPSSSFSALPDMGARDPSSGVQERGRARKSYQDPGLHRGEGRETYARSKEQRICHSPDSLRVHVLFNGMFIIISLKACHKWGRESIIEML